MKRTLLWLLACILLADAQTWAQEKQADEAAKSQNIQVAPIRHFSRNDPKDDPKPLEMQTESKRSDPKEQTHNDPKSAEVKPESKPSDPKETDPVGSFRGDAGLAGVQDSKLKRLKSKDIRIEVSDSLLLVNNQKLSLPAPPEQLVALIGKPTRTVDLRNTLLTWDDLGVYAYVSKETHDVTSVAVYFRRCSYKFSPAQVFEGTLVIDGTFVTSQSSIQNINAGKPERLCFYLGYASGIWDNKKEGKYLLCLSGVVLDESSLGGFSVSLRRVTPSFEIEWKSFTSDEGRFTANFPGEVKVEKSSNAVHTHASPPGVDATFHVAYTDRVTRDDNVEASFKELRRVREVVCKSQEAELVDWFQYLHDGMPACRISLKNMLDEKQAYYHVILIIDGRRFYQVLYGYGIDTPMKQEGELFAKSFRINR